MIHLIIEIHRVKHRKLLLGRVKLPREFPPKAVLRLRKVSPPPAKAPKRQRLPKAVRPRRLLREAKPSLPLR